MPSEIDLSSFLSHTSDNMGTQYVEFPGHGKTPITDAEMRELHNMFSLWSSGGLNAAMALDNFNRFYTIFPEMELPKNLKSYVFMTRPEMNLYSGYRSQALSSENVNNARLMHMNKTNPEILHMLTKEYSPYHDFIPYLQGRTMSLQLPDYQIRTSDFGIPFFGYKYTYPTVTNESITSGSFDITFREDDQLRITKLFQFWIYYMDAINKNIMMPSRSHIRTNEYDYMCSVYELICDPTSEWVLFFAKYTGCVPTGVPISNLSFSLGDSPDNKVGITFNYIRVETMDPAIISDFNSNVHVSKRGPFLDILDEKFDILGPTMSACPVLVTTDDNKLLLKWTPMQDGMSSRLIDGPVDTSGERHGLAKRMTQETSRSLGTPYSDAYMTALEKHLRGNSDRIR